MLFVFGPILHILILHNQVVCFQQLMSLLNQTYIIVSTHDRRQIASETGLKKDSPNLNPNIHV